MANNIEIVFSIHDGIVVENLPEGREWKEYFFDPRHRVGTGRRDIHKLDVSRRYVQAFVAFPEGERASVIPEREYYDAVREWAADVFSALAGVPLEGDERSFKVVGEEGPKWGRKHYFGLLAKSGGREFKRDGDKIAETSLWVRATRSPAPMDARWQPPMAWVTACLASESEEERFKAVLTEWAETGRVTPPAEPLQFTPPVKNDDPLWEPIVEDGWAQKILGRYPVRVDDWGRGMWRWTCHVPGIAGEFKEFSEGAKNPSVLEVTGYHISVGYANKLSLVWEWRWVLE